MLSIQCEFCMFVVIKFVKMTKRIFLIAFSLLIVLLSCKNQQADNATKSNTEDLVYMTVASDEICSIEVPNYYLEMDEINSDPNTLIKYGYKNIS